MMADREFIILAQNDHYCVVSRLANIPDPFPNLQAVYTLDSELSGIVLYAKDKPTAAVLRNRLGSDQMMFHFTLVAKTVSTLADEIICDLSIAQHHQNDCMLIARSTGRKSYTKFMRREVLGSYTIWAAEMHYIRRHQIRLHAHEKGIPILGEMIYNNISMPLLADFKRRVKANRKGVPAPLYPAICIHLSRICFQWEDEEVVMEAPLPQKLNTMLKIIKKWNLK